MATRRDRKRFERVWRARCRPSRRSSRWDGKAWPLAGRSPSGRLARPIAVWLVAPHVSLSGTFVAPGRGRAGRRTRPGRRARSGSRDRRPDEIRRAHLRQLQPVLPRGSGELSEVARRILAEGRVTDLQPGPGPRSRAAESMSSEGGVERGSPESLTGLFAARDRLRRSVAEQEEEFRRTVLLVNDESCLPPPALSRDGRKSPAPCWRNVREGPGMVLKAGATDDDRAASRRFASFQPDADVTVRCAEPERRAAGSRSRRGSCPARRWGLAERTALPGECKIMSADETKRGMGDTAMPRRPYRTLATERDLD